MKDTRTWLLDNLSNDKFSNKSHLISACADAIGVSKKHVKRILREINSDVSTATLEGTNFTTPVLSEIPNIDSLLESMQIDRDNWEITQILSNIWGNASQPNYQLKVSAKKTYLKSLDKAIELIDSKFSTKTELPTLTLTKHDKESYMAEIMIPDLHFGQHSYRNKASHEALLANYLKCIDYFVTILSTQPIDKILLVIGNDFFNSSSMRGETINGTKQKEEANWEKTFTDGVSMLKYTIDSFYLTFQVPIEVITILANHDFESSFYASKILEAYYHDHIHITIDSSRNPYKFSLYGKTLIGFNHGKDIKYDKLPMLMANNSPDWSNSTYREWHLGHIHTKNTFVQDYDVNSVKIKVFPTISPNSDWAENKGYMSNKEGTVLLYSKTRGCIAEYYYREE